MYDSQKITQLRKEGKLDEALALTREALAGEPDNLWNKRAAGWVFYECCKNAIQAKDYQAAESYLAEFDGLALPEDDEVIHKQMTWLRGQLASHTAEKPRNPHALARHYQQLSHKFPGNGLSIGWDLYHDLKALDSAKQSSNEIALEFLRVYAQLNIEKPSLLHSLMLTLAVKLIDNPAKLLDFVKWWGLENLRPEDFERQTQEDRTYYSLAEKLATALSKSIEDQRSAGDASLALPLLERLGNQYPDNIWMRYHQGKLLLLSDQSDAATALIIPVVRAKMSESWAWELLADLHPDDPDIELACLCRALQSRQEEQYLVKIRLRLAAVLADRQDYPAAKCEAEKVQAVYESSNWKLPRELTNLLNAPWYANTVPAADNTELYRTHAPQAEALVLADLPSINGVISRQQPDRDDKPGRTLISYKEGDTIAVIPVKHKQFKWLKKAELGTPVAFRLADDAGRSRLLTLERRQGEPWDVFDPFTGRFKAVKQFGFVQDDATGHDIFIPPYLVADHQLADGQTISGRAEYSEDPKKKQMGWRAVFIFLEES
ncbi:MAG: hypothetical protein DPW09_29720 [Anaerolineae bacterium]|nr:hypothetical protein [Anaerolineae bacterium]